MSEPSPSSPSLFQQVKKVIEDCLEDRLPRPIEGPETLLEGLAMDDLDHIDTILLIEETFGVDLDDVEVNHWVKIGDILDSLCKRGCQEDS